MSIHSNHGIPASSERRAEQLAEMREMLRRQEEERLAELERSRLAAIEGDKRRAAYIESLGLDDIIEIPGRQGGKDVVLRYHERGGRLIEVSDSTR